MKKILQLSILLSFTCLSPCNIGAQNPGSQMSFFTKVGVSPKQRNDNYLYFGTGLNYAGPFKTRMEDVVDLAVAHAGFSQPIRNQ
jgi:carbohydrate-selective porin OprB